MNLPIYVTIFEVSVIMLTWYEIIGDF